MDDIVLAQERRLRSAHEGLLTIYGEIEVLQRRYERSQDRPALDALVTILTNSGEIALLSGRLESSAKWDYSAWCSGPMHPANAGMPIVYPRSTPQHSHNIVSRSLCDAADLANPGCLELVSDMIANGEEIRSIPVLPCRMMLVDDSAALLPLLPTGMEGAVLITATHFVRALRMVFDEYWKRGIPLGTDGLPASAQPGLSSTQRRIVELLLAGSKDEATARQIGASTRTVRRHIEDVMEVLGVHTRIQAGAELVRRGWIG